MGWAIKRADGTYRAWNANAKDDAPQAGEVWEEREAMPSITAPKGPLPDHRVAAKSPADLRSRALGLALIDLINTGRRDLTEADLEGRVNYHIDRL